MFAEIGEQKWDYIHVTYIAVSFFYKSFHLINSEISTIV
jgi:hypothetical protein